MRVPTPTTPAIVEAVARVAHLDAAAQPFSKAHSATQKEGFDTAARLKAALASAGFPPQHLGSLTRDKIIELAGGDPAIAAAPLAALRDYQRAEAAEERAHKVWRRHFKAAEAEAWSIAKLPAPTPTVAFEKAIATLNSLGCKLGRNFKIDDMFDNEAVSKVLSVLLNDLSKCHATPPTPAGDDPVAARLAVVESLDISDGSDGPPANPTDDDRYFNMLIEPIAGDPTTLKGIAWRLARASFLVGSSVEDFEGGVPNGCARIDAELTSIMRALMACGVEATEALTRNFAWKSLFPADGAAMTVQDYRDAGYSVEAYRDCDGFSIGIELPRPGDTRAALFYQHMQDPVMRPEVEKLLVQEATALGDGASALTPSAPVALSAEEVRAAGGAIGRDEVRAMWFTNKAAAEAARRPAAVQ